LNNKKISKNPAQSLVIW